MATAIRSVCLGLMFVCSSTARAEFARGINGGVTDVGPEAGTTSTAPQPFLFRGTDEVLAVAGRTGIYKTVNRGQIWMRSERGLVAADGVEPYVQGLCQASSAPEIAYASTLEGGVSRTTDFGDSWEAPTPLANPGSACAVDPSDASVVYALAAYSDEFSPGRLYKSTDGGRSFYTVGSGLPDQQEPADALAVAPTNPLTVYVGLAIASGGLFVSSDGGLNFSSLPNSPSFPWAVYGHPTDDGTLFVLTDGGLFLSIDGGESFAQIGAGLPVPPGVLAFDPVDPSIVYAPGGPDGLFRSVDGARTFARIDALSEDQLIGLGVLAVAVSPRSTGDPPVIYAGTSLGPIRSDDGGNSFVPIHDGYRGVSVNDIAFDAAGRLLLASNSSAGVFRSTGPGAYQIIGDTLAREIATYVSAVAAAPDDPDLYVVGPGAGSGVFRTTDGGRSWTQAMISGNPSFNIRMRIAFAPSDSRRVYVVSGSGTRGLFISSDAGESFDQVAVQPLTSIAVDPRDPDVLFVGSWIGVSGLFKSTDGGHTLRLVANGPFTSIAIDPQRPQVIYAGLRLGANAVLRSVDGGQSFTPAAQGLIGDRVLGLGIVPSQPTRLFVWMHAGGLFRSNDGAGSWVVVDTGETLRRSTDVSGQTALAIDGSEPENVYLGHASVLQFVNQ